MHKTLHQLSMEIRKTNETNETKDIIEIIETFENENEEENRKKNHIFNLIKKVFPYWKTELALVLSCVSVIVFAYTLNYMTTISNEMELMHSVSTTDKTDNAVNNSDIGSDEENNNKQESDFSINNPEQEEPIVTTDIITYETYQICFIGDQRTVYMQSVLLTDSKFIVDSSANVDWLNNTAKSQFETLSSDVCICVVSLGLNDLDKSAKYISSMNEWANDNTDIIFVFVNVGPVDETQYSEATNERIQNFNTAMSAGLNGKWQIVDLYQYIIDNNIQTTDGINYSIGDLANIFSWLVDSVSNQVVKH